MFGGGPHQLLAVRSGWPRCPLRGVYLYVTEFLERTRALVNISAADLAAPTNPLTIRPFSVEEFHWVFFHRFCRKQSLSRNAPPSDNEDNSPQPSRSNAIVFLTRPHSQTGTLHVYREVVYTNERVLPNLTPPIPSSVYGTNEGAYVIPTLANRDMMLSVVYQLGSYSIIRYVSLRIILNAVCKEMADGSTPSNIRVDGRFRDSIFLTAVDDNDVFGKFFDSASQVCEYLKNSLRDFGIRNITEFSATSILALPGLKTNYRAMWNVALPLLPLGDMQILFERVLAHPRQAVDENYHVNIPVTAGCQAQQDALDVALTQGRIKAAYQSVQGTGVITHLFFSKLLDIKRQQLAIRKRMHEKSTAGDQTGSQEEARALQAFYASYTKTLGHPSR